MYPLDHVKNQDTFEDTQLGLNLFCDPPGFYPDSPPPTNEAFKLRSGHIVSVALVGHDPLWGHYLWNAGRKISRYLELNTNLLRGKTVLELGAGSGLPSLVSAYLGADLAVVTDYPNLDLLNNLKRNVKNFYETNKDNLDCMNSRLIVEGYRWGDECQKLKSHLPAEREGPTGFDVLIMADLLFNHSEHAKLVETVQKTLKRDVSAKALVFFTPYRPWLLKNDLAFFDLAQAGGMIVEKVLEEKMDKVMFEEDNGDEELRKTVFGYVLRWNL